MGLMAGVFFLSSCVGGAGSSEARRTIEAGVTVVRYPSDEPPAREPYDFDTEPVLYGTDQTPDTYLLTSHRTTGVLSDGSVVVADNRTSTLHLFAPDGPHLRTIGRGGRGPGELNTVFLTYVHRDTIVVPDVDNRRLTRFAPDGTYLGQEVLPADLPSLNMQFAPGPGGGYAIAQLDGRGIGGGVSSGGAFTFRWEFSAFRLDAAFERLEAWLDTSYMTEWPILGNKYLAGAPFRYDDHLEYGFSRHGLAWADGPEYRLMILDFTTGESTRVEIPREGRPVDAAARRAFVQDYLARQYDEAALNRLDFPERMPAIGGIIWDEQGRIWVSAWVDYVPDTEDGPAPETHFDVFSADGNWLFEQTLPAMPALITSAGVYSDGALEDGTPVIRFYRLGGD
jgi:hypothetical protein